MPELTVDTFSGEADLEELVRFASENTQARRPHKAQWHAGDIVWMLSDLDTTKPIESLHLWREGTHLVAVAWFESPTHTRIDVLGDLPYHEALLDSILELCDAAFSRARPPDREPRALFTIAFDSDTRRIEALAANGYRPAGAQAVHLERNLESGAVAASELPAGMTFQDGRGIDVDERVAVHVDAWSHLGHLGMPDAKSGFSAARYRRIIESPTFRPELDLVVATEDGQYVSSALCWIDPESRIGLTEPVGTRDAFRGRGLSRAINLECLRRLRDHGMHTAVIQTAHFNAAARATYLSCGYRLVDTDSWFVKPLR